MSTRLLKPSAGVVARTSKAMVDSGDGVVYPVLGGFGSLIATGVSLFGGIGGGVEGMFGLLILPALYLISMVAYQTGTKEISYRDYQWYTRVINQHMPKIRGHQHETLAQPMVEQVYKCTIEGHPTAAYGKNCPLCTEREKMIKALIPNDPTDRNDIDAAKRYIENKKEADALHAQALKELLN